MNLRWQGVRVVAAVVSHLEQSGTTSVQVLGVCRICEETVAVL